MLSQAKLHAMQSTTANYLQNEPHDAADSNLMFGTACWCELEQVKTNHVHADGHNS